MGSDGRSRESDESAVENVVIAAGDAFVVPLIAKI
jgi:hypothetical protein